MLIIQYLKGITHFALYYLDANTIMGKDEFRVAPIFDNGKALLVGNYSYSRYDTIQEKVKKVIARPFSGSHEWQYEYFKDYCDIEFDKSAILKELRKLERTSEVEIAIYQVETNL